MSLKRKIAAAGLVLAVFAALFWSTAPTGDIFEQDRAAGGLRDDFAPSDAPFGADDLVANFRSIAFSSEFRLPGESDRDFLVRWTGPIRYEVIGATVTAADRAVIDDLASRFRGLTGLSIEPDADEPNFSIMILTPDERDAVLAEISEFTPAEKMDAYRRWSEAENDHCVFEFRFDETGAIFSALAVIKARYGDLGRRVCLHEEMAQALGLANDSYDARPSIFNDDHEFAYLTLHDEMLIRMLYDPRLRTGVKPGEAMQVLPSIARDVFGEMSQ